MQKRHQIKINYDLLFLNLLFSNLASPSLLFFVVGIWAEKLKGDLVTPPTSTKFIGLVVTFPFQPYARDAHLLDDYSSDLRKG
jgi:hypothetical protein